jgi:GntR family transcriptional repressor for pyruvate dehydrogenase complex
MSDFIVDAVKKEEIVGAKSAISSVINYITETIMSRKLRAGDKIPTEVELCRELDVSRSTVREAIKILEAMGIVEIRRGFGTYISSSRTIFSTAPVLYKMLLLDTPREVTLEFRNQIEQNVIRLCSKNATPEDIRELEQSIEDLKAFIDAGGAKDEEELLRRDLAFHKILARATGNVLIEEIYYLCLDLLMPTIKGQDGKSAVTGHTLLLDALKNGDVAYIDRTVSKVIYEYWSIWVKNGREKPGATPQ